MPKNNALSKRRLPRYTGYLLEKCAHLYLLFPPAKLLAAAANKIEPVDALVAALAAQHLAAHASSLAAHTQLELLRASSRVEVVESPVPLGVLDPATTARNLALLRPPVWRRVARGPSPQERLCLCTLLAETSRLLDRAAKALQEALKTLAKQGIDPSSPTLRRLEKRTARAQRQVKRLLLRTCGAHSPRKPPQPARCSQAVKRRGRRLCRAYTLLERTLGALNTLLEEREIPLALTARGVEEPAIKPLTAIRMSLERLYEFYTLYILLKALQNLGTVTARDTEITVTVTGDGKITVLYNTRPKTGDEPLSRIALGTSNQLTRDELERISGIPDITLIADNQKRIVIEVKHSRNPAYLTLARFKTIAYIHEYNADAGILVYPGKAATKPTPPDEEYKATHILLERAEQHGHIEIKLHQNASLIILPLQPTRSNEERNIEKVTDVLEAALAGS